MVVAGLPALTPHGVNAQIAPPACVEIDAGELSEAERERLAIEQLPQSLEPALELTKTNSLARQAFGSPLFDGVLEIRGYERDTSGAISIVQRIEKLRWRY